MGIHLILTFVLNPKKQHDDHTLISSPFSVSEVLKGAGARPLFPLDRIVEYFGCVNYATNERVINQIKKLSLASNERVYMVVTSAGGPSGSAMGFFDALTSLIRANLTTIGAGDVDSSGMVVFLTGEKRYVTKHTSGLLHPAGGVFENGKRMSAVEVKAILDEYEFKDEQYAEILSSRSRGKITKAEVLALMHAHTTLKPEDFIRYGFADSIL